MVRHLHVSRLCIAALMVSSPLAASDPAVDRWLIIYTSAEQITNTARVTANTEAFQQASANIPGFAFSGAAELHIRGASTRMFPKKSYALELQDEHGKDLKTSLFDLPEDSDWVLYASYSDKTFSRDALAYDLWRAIGHYAPRTTYVDVFLLGETADGKGFPDPSAVDYRGTYVLVEKIKRGDARVNILKMPKLASPSKNGQSARDVSGGYIFKKDRLGPDEKGLLLVLSKTQITLVEPKERAISAVQKSWLTDYLNEFEATLFAERFTDPTNGYAKYIDIDSFVDYHWMTEVGKNMDGYRFSQFYHKDRGGKLKMGPLWDWDLSFGNAAYMDGWLTNSWRWEKMRGDLPEYCWFKRLFEDPDFLQRYIDRWSELRTNILATSNVLARVDRFAAEVRPMAERNYQCWPTLGKRVHPNYFVGKTYDEEVQWLKDWIVGRLAWIDSQDFPKPIFQVISPLLSASLTPFTLRAPVRTNSAFSLGGSALAPSTLLSINCDPAAGSIFYTTDNTDPRLRGGHVSTNAIHYTTPISITPGLHIRARVLSEYGLWSAPALYP